MLMASVVTLSLPKVFRRVILRVDAGTHRITRLNTFGSDNVTEFAISLLQQCNVRRAVRIILQAFDNRRNTIFSPLKIDNTVVLLMTTTNVTSSNAASIVTATRLTLSFYQRLVRTTFVQIRVVKFYNVTASGRCWLGLDDRHITTPLPYSTSRKSMS